MIRVDVVGSPAPQGSLKAFVVAGRACVTADNPRTRPWRNEVAQALAAAVSDTVARPLWPSGPVAVGAVFRVAVPKRWIGARGVKPGAPVLVATKPDRDKYERLVGDAITASGVVWGDDSQSAIGASAKVYVPPGQWTGVSLVLAPADEWDEVFRAVADLVTGARAVMGAAIEAAIMARVPGGPRRRAA